MDMSLPIEPRVYASNPLRHRPELDIRVPFLAGVCAVSVFLGGGLCAAALTSVEKGVSLSGSVKLETKSRLVDHPRGGIVTRIHVVEGQRVEAGDVLVSFDTKALDEEIAALKAQSEDAARQLDEVRLEAATIKDLYGRKLAPRAKVAELEAKVAAVEKDAAGLGARIALASQELERAAIRAPVGGRIQSLKIAGPGVVLAAGAPALEIVPAADRLLVEGRLPPGDGDSLKAGMPAKVWLAPSSWIDARPIDARLAWISPEKTSTGTPSLLARVEIDAAAIERAGLPALKPGMPAELMLVTGQRTLLDQIADPLIRTMRRMFGG